MLRTFSYLKAIEPHDLLSFFTKVKVRLLFFSVYLEAATSISPANFFTAKM